MYYDETQATHESQYVFELPALLIPSRYMDCA
jgi:hypothetical protein